MGNRLNRVLALAWRVNELRVQLTAAETELDGMLGGGAEPPVDALAPGDVPAPAKKPRVAKEPKPQRNGAAPRGERRKQIVALVKAGKSAHEVAAELGISKDNARVNIIKARHAGDLPKGDPKK